MAARVEWLSMTAVDVLDVVSHRLPLRTHDLPIACWGRGGTPVCVVGDGPNPLANGLAVLLLRQGQHLLL
jgi:hypothetical protein